MLKVLAEWRILSVKALVSGGWKGEGCLRMREWKSEKINLLGWGPRG